MGGQKRMENKNKTLSTKRCANIETININNKYHLGEDAEMALNQKILYNWGGPVLFVIPRIVFLVWIQLPHPCFAWFSIHTDWSPDLLMVCIELATCIFVPPPRGSVSKKLHVYVMCEVAARLGKVYYTYKNSSQHPVWISPSLHARDIQNLPTALSSVHL